MPLKLATVGKEQAGGGNMADFALDVASAPSRSIHCLSARADSKAASQYRAAVVTVNKIERPIHAVSPGCVESAQYCAWPLVSVD